MTNETGGHSLADVPITEADLVRLIDVERAVIDRCAALPTSHDHLNDANLSTDIVDKIKALPVFQMPVIHGLIVFSPVELQKHDEQIKNRIVKEIAMRLFGGTTQ